MPKSKFLFQEIKKFFNYLKKSRLVGGGFAGAILINLFFWLFLYFRLNSVNEPIPLYYDIYSGVNSIGEWTKLFKLPLAGLIILVINLILAFVFYKKEKMIDYFLAFGSLAMQCLLLLEGLLILNL